MRPALPAYLVLEAMVGGALLGAAMAITLAMLLDGRTAMSFAANRASAAALGRAKADELASSSTCVGSSALVNVGADYPGFQWSWSAANAASMTASTPALSTELLCDATVTLEYPAKKGSAEDRTDGAPTNGRARLVMRRMWHP